METKKKVTQFCHQYTNRVAPPSTRRGYPDAVEYKTTGKQTASTHALLPSASRANRQLELHSRHQVVVSERLCVLQESVHGVLELHLGHGHLSLHFADLLFERLHGGADVDHDADDLSFRFHAGLLASLGSRTASVTGPGCVAIHCCSGAIIATSQSSSAPTHHRHSRHHRHHRHRHAWHCGHSGHCIH